MSHFALALNLNGWNAANMTETENDKQFVNFITNNELSKGFIPQNTTNSTSWTLQNYKAQKQAGNTH